MIQKNWSEILGSRKHFWYFLASLSILRSIYVLLIPITPQEAYYWNYAQHLDLSYFDHPPMAAYSIWLGTLLFGDTSFGVKFMGLVWSLITNVLLYVTTYRALDLSTKPLSTMNPAEKNALSFIAVILYNLTIFAHLYAITLMPDTPLLAFWLLAIFFYQEQIYTNHKIYWLYTGMALGFALLSKYTAIALVPGILLYILFSKEDRKILLKPYPYLALLSALLVFLPVIIWNWQHDWASFIYQFGDRAGDTKLPGFRYVGQLLASQFFQLLPLMAILIPIMFIRLLREFRQQKPALFFVLTGLPVTLGFSLISLTSLVKMNWLLPGYLGMIIAVVLLFNKSLLKPGRWMKITGLIAIVLIIISHSILLIPNMPLGEGNTWSGWKDVTPEIYQKQNQLGGPDNCFIFSNSYKSASLLKFYLPDHQETFAQNIYGRPALQFDFWSDPDLLQSRDALYIRTDRREYKDDLQFISSCFEEINLIETYEIKFGKDTAVRKIYCYHAKSYRGLSGE